MHDLEAFADVAGAEMPVDDGLKQRLTTEERWTCVIMHKQGKGYRDIANTINCYKDTVGEVWRRYLCTGDVGSGSRSGRKAKDK